MYNCYDFAIVSGHSIHHTDEWIDLSNGVMKNLTCFNWKTGLVIDFVPVLNFEEFDEKRVLRNAVNQPCTPNKTSLLIPADHLAAQSDEMKILLQLKLFQDSQ